MLDVASNNSGPLESPQMDRHIAKTCWARLVGQGLYPFMGKYTGTFDELNFCIMIIMGSFCACLLYQKDSNRIYGKLLPPLRPLGCISHPACQGTRRLKSPWKSWKSPGHPMCIGSPPNSSKGVEFGSVANRRQQKHTTDRFFCQRESPKLQKLATSGCKV